MPSEESVVRKVKSTTSKHSSSKAAASDSVDIPSLGQLEQIIRNIEEMDDQVYMSMPFKEGATIERTIKLTLCFYKRLLWAYYIYESADGDDEIEKEIEIIEASDNIIDIDMDILILLSINVNDDENQTHRSFYPKITHKDFYGINEDNTIDISKPMDPTQYDSMMDQVKDAIDIATSTVDKSNAAHLANINKNYSGERADLKDIDLMDDSTLGTIQDNSVEFVTNMNPATGKIKRTRRYKISKRNRIKRKSLKK